MNIQSLLIDLCSFFLYICGMTNIQKISQGARFSLTNYPERVFRIKDNVAQFWSGGDWIDAYKVESFIDGMLFIYIGNVTFEFIVRNSGTVIFE